MNITRMIVILFLLVNVGCVASYPTAFIPLEQLNTQIRSGELLSEGQEIIIVTSDGEEHRISVTKIDDVSVYGDEESIRIDDIVTLKTREFSLNKTLEDTGYVIKVGGTLLLLAGLAVIAIIAM